MDLDLPAVVERLADELMGCAGAEAVVVGGSRAIGRHRPDSDWDLGLYYRGTIELEPLAGHGVVHPPGSWGRIMNGGSWLRLDEVRIDVLLRDLDVVDHWAGEAGAGRFEVDGLPGYVAGITTYSLVAEAHSAVPVRGRLDLDTTFPAALAAAAPGRWRFNRDFSLYHAAQHSERGGTDAALGMAARAVLEEAHARRCAQRRWVLNEKHLPAAAGMADVDRWLADLLASGAPATVVVEDLRQRFGSGDPLT